ncbi:hypothetical protein T02_10916 [Trichinella nativa]|uniref:Uncharacterized protein n=1 Tax=Trichinella nativa TaxID=6335 RepID=A0A0V1KJ90_9BILA|nr:hypothetical protein T02_10916 [Trichinella nativa]
MRHQGMHRESMRKVQLHITAQIAEYDGGTRTMEQFLRAVAYDVPEPVNFMVPSEYIYFNKLLTQLLFFNFLY